MHYIYYKFYHNNNIIDYLGYNNNIIIICVQLWLYRPRTLYSTLPWQPLLNPGSESGCHGNALLKHPSLCHYIYCIAGNIGGDLILVNW